jgi:hypothetical protein
MEEAFQEQLKRNAVLKQKEADLREMLFGLQIQALHHEYCECRDLQGYNGRRAQDVANTWNLDLHVSRRRHESGNKVCPTFNLDAAA